MCNLSFFYVKLPTRAITGSVSCDNRDHALIHRLVVSLTSEDKFSSSKLENDSFQGCGEEAYSRLSEVGLVFLYLTIACEGRTTVCPFASRLFRSLFATTPIDSIFFFIAGISL